MIGVLVAFSEREVAREFFQLCKTPWEFYHADRRYAVVLSTHDLPPTGSARLVLIYRAGPTPFDAAHDVRIDCPPGPSELCPSELSWWDRRLPIYGPIVFFPGDGHHQLLTTCSSTKAVFCHRRVGESMIARIGYDLFGEIQFLLSSGQPVENAGIPTLDLHIALLREVICAAGITFVEIPPVPDRHTFIACLTHDIDHPLLSRHRCDCTMLGFLHRATIGSAVDILLRRRRVKSLWRNWRAAAQLPFVYLNLARDPWGEFDRYAEIEHGLRATYFVIPTEQDSGRLAGGRAPALRASAYKIEDITPQLRRVRAAGAEVGVHGLDAWLDPNDGRRERATVCRSIGPGVSGVRMHWLYFDRHSPQALEEAGYRYDSSFGYNETIGYRAGTAQVYRPPGATTLLELPLHIMDTALFFPSFLHLRDHQAWARIQPMLDHATAGGGVLTVNWHDRSIAPERLWEEFYLELVGNLKQSGAWFPTASQAVEWFSIRRDATFHFKPVGTNGGFDLRVDAPSVGTLPQLRLRLSRPAGNPANELFASPALSVSSDLTFDGTAQLRIDP